MTEEEIEKEVAEVILDCRDRYDNADETAKSVLSRLKELGWGPLPPTR